MSQPNNHYPSFNFGEPYYGSESGQSYNNASFSQWLPQGSQSRANAASSPSPSVQTATSAPNPRPPNIISFNPSLPNSSLLTVPPGSRSRSSLDNTNPIARFYSEDSPWSSERMRSSNVPFGRSSLPQPKMDYVSYREGPGSEIESIAPRSDSGYHTLHSHSIISHDQSRVDHELPHEVIFDVENMQVRSATSEPGDMLRATSSVTDRASQYSGRSVARSTGQGKEIKCTECKEVSKCRSDHKKHMLRHHKPYKCLLPNCRRAGKGFTTVNDLNRHKKSVHRIGATDNSYQCASENCRNKEKIWPRLDNFKQHIHRMHKDEDEQELIGRSAYQAQEPVSSAEPMSVAPMDTTLAGIGTEKQFSNQSNELDDPVSGISLTPDQEANHWNSFDPSMHEFAMDVDQSNPHSLGHGSRRTNVGAALKHPSQGQATTLGTNSTSPTLDRRTSFQRLETLAHAASSQVSTGTPVQPIPPRLSSAPQTKADQQREALQKFSGIIARNIQNAPTNEAGDLENVILRVLTSTIGRKDLLSLRQSSTQASNQRSLTDQALSDDAVPDTLTKKEALKATQAMTNLAKQAPNVRPRQLGSISANMKKCEHCPVTVARACDMRKHMKRHTRPYGCTYPKCHKRFGAKSDWKRHENSQHFQLESFRCQQLSPASQTPCGELFYRAKNFEAHLAEQHKISSDTEVAHEVRMRRIGKNGQGQFWCGFCERIVQLRKKRNEAWDERFDHIDRHFNKEGKRIEEWHCVEARKAKGEVLKEVDKWVFDEDDTEEWSAEDDQTSPNVMGQAQPSMTSAASASGSNSRKRPTDADMLGHQSPQKRNKREIFKYCCSCEGGPWGAHTFLICMDCNHRLCNNCSTAVVRLKKGSMSGEAELLA